VFHELAHQLVYVNDDSVFNESFATAVEEAGLRRWIAAQSSTPAHPRLEAEQARGDRLRGEFRRLTRSARTMLMETYAAKASEAEKRARKEAIFSGMRKAYEEAKAGEGGLAGFDHWFSGYDGRGPNNASIASLALYDDKVPAFRALLARCNGDLPTFYEKVRELAARPKFDRDRTLAALIGDGVTRPDAGLATEVGFRPAR
jgi:predicted aminopeptidase